MRLWTCWSRNRGAPGLKSNPEDLAAKLYVGESFRSRYATVRLTWRFDRMGCNGTAFRRATPPVAYLALGRHET
jgi:hypothetical protein